ncbi:MAG: lipopolysaccharide biosynthesis protein RfbH [Nanoarchaeota archaeon]|nr:lipopolysaccharide biosynthesis protein RfbH [Nanoarchaeota archaeon]
MNNQEIDRIKSEIKGLVRQYYQLRFSDSEFVEGVTRIDPSGKLFREEELINGIEAVLDGHWTEGRFTDEFEQKLSDYIGLKYSLFVNSGSSANLLAFSSLTSSKLGDRRIRKGDEVIAVASCFPTTLAPIVQNGAIPVFLDIYPLETGLYNMDCSKLEEAVTEKTKAIFIAHTLGNPFDLNEIMRVKEKYGLWLIEDCCDALGSKHNGKNVGTFGDLATFSFFPAHHITTGEGGAVLTKNSNLFNIVRSFRNWGRDCWCAPGFDNTCGKRFEWKLGDMPEGYDHKNLYSHFGYNMKSTDLQAAIGIAQLDRIEEFLKARADNFNFLMEKLKPYEQEIILPNSLPNTQPNWFGFLISTRKESKIKRDDLVRYLTENKVMTRPLFCGNITRQPCFTEGDAEYRIAGSLENSDLAMHNTFWVGIQPNITPEKREYMAKVLVKYFSSQYD